MKSVLVYSTLSSGNRFFADLIGELGRKAFHLTVIARAQTGNGIRFRSPRLPSAPFLVLVLLPLWRTLGLISLLMKKAGGIEALICCGDAEKIILTPAAKLLGLNVVWLEFPDEDRAYRTGWLASLLRRASRQARVVVFSSETESALRDVLAPDTRFNLVLPAARQETNRYQEDMFRRLAGGDRHRFVIGSIIDQLDKPLIERLLSALAIAKTVSAAIELVIIGEGETRKQLQWLMRKMGLERNVWLVGGAEESLQWLEHLNVYILPHERPSLDDIGGAIAAMSRAVPVLAHTSAGVSDIVNAKTGALLDMADSETLARHLLKLEQDQELCRALGREAQARTRDLTVTAAADKLAALV